MENKVFTSTESSPFIREGMEYRCLRGVDYSPKAKPLSSCKNDYIGYVDPKDPKGRQVSIKNLLNKIVVGDCIDVLKTLPGGCVDFVLTDPPYVTGYVDRTGRTVANDNNAEWLAPSFEQIYRVLKPNSLCVSFYGWNKADLFLGAWRAAGFYPVGHIVWQKSYTSKTVFLSYTHEAAYLLAKGRPEKPKYPLPDILPWEYTENTFHPTQKPVMALEPLIHSFTNPGDIILDPFSGSGSTALAAARLDRQFIAIELENDYARIAARRLRNLVS